MSNRLNLIAIAEYETQAVAGILMAEGALAECSEIEGRHFRDERLGRAWDIITSAYATGASPLDALVAQGWTATQLSALIDACLAPAQTAQLARRVLDSYHSRQLRASLHQEVEELREDPIDSPVERIGRIREALDDLAPVETTTDSGSSALILQLFKELDTSDDVVPTGFTWLDHAFRGWPKGTLTILGSRPGMGKSAFLLNAALRLARAGVPVLYIGLEDRREQHMRRLLSIASEVPLSHIVYSVLQSPIRTAIFEKMKPSIMELAKLPIHIVDGPLTTRQIVAVGNQHIKQHGCQVVMVDHAQEIIPDEEQLTAARAYQIQASAQRLRDFAKQTYIPVILASQINRDAEKAPRPQVSHLRDSGALEMIGRLILLLYRDEVSHPDTESPGIMEVIVGKANHGPTGITIRQKWTGECCKVDDLGRDM